MTEVLPLIFVALGMVVVGATLHDFLATVLTVTGGGPFTGRLNTGLWWLTLRIHRRWPSHQLLAWVGPMLAGLTLLVWAAMLWLGWTLLFSGPSFAVVDAKTGQPADLWSRVYYVGFTLTTLGMGDYVPGTRVAKAATVVASANGLLLFTMAITYIVPVVSAAAQKRSLAAYIATLGRGPVPILRRAWDGRTFEAAASHFVELAPMLTAITQQHLTYPILHYFHSHGRETALPVQLAVLDETLMLLQHGVAAEARPHTFALDPARRAMAHFLTTLDRAFIHPTDSPPPPVPLERLEESGPPTVGAPAYDSAVAAHADRRCLLLGLVDGDGWSWADVTGEASDSDLPRGERKSGAA